MAPASATTGKAAKAFTGGLSAGLGYPAEPWMTKARGSIFTVPIFFSVAVSGC